MEHRLHELEGWLHLISSLGSARSQWKDKQLQSLDSCSFYPGCSGETTSLSATTTKKKSVFFLGRKTKIVCHDVRSSFGKM